MHQSMMTKTKNSAIKHSVIEAIVKHIIKILRVSRSRNSSIEKWSNEVIYSNFIQAKSLF